MLAVCSCTILPLFAGIYHRGAGLGPAITFLYTGPAINILAIILTARILGFGLGIARIAGAVIFSVVIGLIMHFVFLKDDNAGTQSNPDQTASDGEVSQIFIVLQFLALVGVLVFATWQRPATPTGIWFLIWQAKWWLSGFFSILLLFTMRLVLRLSTLRLAASVLPVGLSILFFGSQPLIPFSVAILTLIAVLGTGNARSREWLDASWGFTAQILPLLAGGVLLAGFLLGSPENQAGIIPNSWVAQLVGGNSLLANLFAAVVGAFMYFATLTEVPIVSGLLSSGMGQGPALALLLAGPALSLPNMLVIRSVIGTRKTSVFVALVVVMATVSGWIYGLIIQTG